MTISLPARAIDLTGQVVGRLTVVTYLGDGRWDCQCECGGTKSVSSHSLRRSSTRSCGCLQRETRTTNNAKRWAENRSEDRLPIGEAAFRSLLHSYKKSARSRGYEFTLDPEDFRQLVTAECHYCGDPPKRTFRTYTKTPSTFLYNGIDRKDNNVGYRLQNCVTACADCNLFKHSRSHDEFLSIIKKIAHHRIRALT